ncbi:MAG TPA: hypothetical protein VN085_10035 [Vicinamibacterales bacterium]|jgi:hypothetical protein|nr:hypothetical protein [Vicinamibacterales bacterium]
MAKRKTTTTRTGGKTTTRNAETTPGALEQRAMALAEELGRIAGTLHAKAEGWMDRATLAQQIASVRDSAVELLEQVGGGTKAAPEQPSATPARRDTPTRQNAKGRSGGVVDAPGKRHRKPLPPDPDVPRAASQAAKMRTAKTMVKTNRLRGRG